MPAFLPFRCRPTTETARAAAFVVSFIVVFGVAAKEGIPWRAWWEDPAAEQLVSEKWNVHGWPTLYLLDAQGIVRYKGDLLRGITVKSDGKGRLQPVYLLDEAVDKLLQEMSKRK